MILFQTEFFELLETSTLKMYHLSLKCYFYFTHIKYGII